MTARRLATALICFCFAGEIALADPEGVTKGATVEGITEYRLSNGLKLLLLPDDSKPTVTVNITYLVGSRHEGYGEAGMAHLLEHMLFKGTPTHPNVPAAMKERGAQFNGTTWFDRTNYYETLPASNENLEFALRLEADRMVNSHVAAADLLSEMTVVRNEFERGENSPQRVLMQRMLAASFEWHNYGKSTIGNRADIERVPIDNLRDFYRRYYRPDNCLLIIAGKFDEPKALELTAKYFGTLEKPTTKLNATYTEEPAQDGERIVRLRRVGTVPIVGLVYHVPAGGHADFPAVDLLGDVLTADVSGRLYKSLVETKKAATVGGFTFSLHDPGAMLIFAQATPGTAPADLQATMLATIDEVASKGVTEEEVERVRTTSLKQRELAAAESARLAIQLSDWAAQGDWRLYFVYRDRLEKVTAEQVSAAAAKYLKADNRTVGLFEPTTTPDRSTIPQFTDLEQTVGGYKGREDVATGEQFDVSPANIDARTKRLTLRSGVKAALIEKKTRANSVTLRLSLKYGTVDSLKGTQSAAELLPVLMKRGTKSLSRQEIDDQFDKLRAQVSASGSPGVAVFTIRARRQTLPAVLGLLRQILREPSLPEKELDLLKQASLSGLEQGLTDPQTLAERATARHLAPYAKDDPRYVPTVPEEIELLKGVEIADVRTLYEKFLSGQNGELTIVGDFDASEIVPSVESLLDGWKTEQKYVRIPRPVSAVPGGKEQILTPDKKNAVYAASESFAMRDNDPEYPALAIGNYVLGGGALASRLGDRIRQKDGLSYTIRSSLQVSSVDENAVFDVFAISNPDNMPKVEKAVIEEIEKLLKDGLTDEELERARQGWLQQQQITRSDDGRMVALLANNIVAGRTMDHYGKQDAKIQALTKEDVVKALRKRIDLKKLFLSTAGDFK
ncbi:MAG: pitrilysin family protein [Planctomycetota bacterium]|nr:pitrilysin family protein [Planctomycetota bacterium]